MAKLSTEATIGLGLELLLAILERLHIREPLLIWGLFALGLLLIGDSIVRGEWAEKIADPARRRKKRRRMGVIAGLVFALFAWWVFVRMQTPSENEEVMVSPPHAQPQQPEAPEKTPPVSIPPTKPAEPTKKAVGTPPAVTQDCGGGNCAASVGQQGGITAGQINVDTDRRLSPKQIADIGAAKAACATMPLVNVTASSDEAKRYAYQLIGALHDAGCRADLVLPIPGLRPNVLGVHVGVRDPNKNDPSAVALGEILSRANVPFSFTALESDFFPGEAFVLVIGAKEPPTAVKDRTTKSSPPNKVDTSARQQQFCGGGNCAQSSGQSGGITAGQISVGAVPKHLPPNYTSALTDFLFKARSSAAGVKIAIAADQYSRPSPFVDEFYEMFKAAQWPMRDDGVSDVMVFSSPTTKKFQGAVVTVKGEPLKPDEQIQVKAPDPLLYIGSVLETLKINRSLTRSPDAAEGVILIQFQGGFPD